MGIKVGDKILFEFEVESIIETMQGKSVYVFKNFESEGFKINVPGLSEDQIEKLRS